MSNYLDNLVMRNQQAMEVVRPRLPAIFEPPAAMPFASSMPQRVAQLGSMSPPDDSSRQRSEGEPLNEFPNRDNELLIERVEQRERPIQSRDQARVPESSEPATTVPAWRGVQVINESTTPSDQPALRNQGSSDLSPRSSTVSNVTEQGIRSLTTDPRKATHDHQPKREGWTEEILTDRRQPEREMSQEDQSRSSLLAPTQRRTPLAAPFTDPADRHISVRPRVRSIRQAARENGRDDFDGYTPRREAFVQPAVEPPTPTINVTIGRIEVKAVPPAAASPQPRKSTPSLMSLDEYMRRRNAGGDSR